MLLGDYTENLLKSVGITKEAYAEIKGKFGLAPSCNCDKRQAWLNEVGLYFAMRIKPRMKR